MEVTFLFLHVVCYSSRFFKNKDAGEDSGATHRQEMLVSDSRKGGVNGDSESNKPLCDAALTGRPDNATQGQNKSALLTQTGYYLLCPQLSQNSNCGATDSLSQHTVIYISVIYHAWRGSANI